MEKWNGITWHISEIVNIRSEYQKLKDAEMLDIVVLHNNEELHVFQIR